jgi:hypothetical protein
VKTPRLSGEFAVGSIPIHSRQIAKTPVKTGVFYLTCPNIRTRSEQ